MKTFDLGTFAKAQGWSLAGVCKPEISQEHQELYLQWLEKYKGPQMHYLKKRVQEKLHVGNYFPPTRSILCFGLFYFPGWAKGKLRVSNYAWGEDYHQLLSEKLEHTAGELKKQLGDFEYRACVDTAPVHEKYWAAQAGIGWQGKNTLILNRQYGSMFFLGELLCSLPIQYFQANLAQRDLCGTCSRCIEACPTGALQAYVLDASKCISYWTLEHKGAFNEQTPPYDHWLAGCDICQQVCPWNHKLTSLNSPEIDLGLGNLSPDELEQPQWRERIRNKAINYVKEENWKRNLKQLS